jgi:hypothetical protein
MRKKMLVIVFVTVLALVCGSIVVFAANDTYGSYKSFTVGGNGYKNRSSMYAYSSPKRLQPRTYIGTNPSRTVGAGYLGANCRLYRDSTGALVFSTGYLYSSSSCVSVDFGGNAYSGGVNGAAYHSTGVSRVYSNGSYTNTTAYASPSTNF